MEPSVTDNDANDKITISDPKEANAMHEHILGSLKRTAREIYALGEYVCAVRATKKKGEWGPWREKNLPSISERACQEYAAFYKRAQRNNGFELIETCRLLSPLPVKKEAAKATAAAPPPIPEGVNETVVNDLLSTGQFTREQAITVARRAEPVTAEPGKTIETTTQPPEQPREEPARTVRIDDLEPVRPPRLDNLAGMVGLCANLEEIEEDDYEAVEEFAQQFAQTAFELFDAMVDNRDPEEMLDRFKEAVANLKIVKKKANT
jgi:hypothetical protein